MFIYFDHAMFISHFIMPSSSQMGKDVTIWKKRSIATSFLSQLNFFLSQQQDIRRYYGCHYVSHCNFVFHAFLIFFSYSNCVLCTHDQPPPPPHTKKTKQLSIHILLTSVLLFAHSGSIIF